jgi:hypothetical protein
VCVSHLGGLTFEDRVSRVLTGVGGHYTRSLTNDVEMLTTNMDCMSSGNALLMMTASQILDLHDRRSQIRQRV